MTVRSRTIGYSDGGKTFEGFLAWDDSHGGARPGVLISHAWGGAGDFEHDKARALAELGYVGFCVDLYGQGIRGTTPEENSKLMQPLLDDRALLQRRMKRSLEVAREQKEVDQKRMAGIGFCFGGLCILDLARTGADLHGVVSFHGLFFPPGNLEGSKIKAKVLALHGWNDPLATPDLALALAKELTDAGADWQIHAYGHTMHAFTNPQAHSPEHGLQYNATAERRAWQAMRSFFEELFPAS